jgi:2-keto-4-pentenoate hydratase/2-oxohepta-3-ene-1,7-dioic acid hydratase in catechol pathway
MKLVTFAAKGGNRIGVLQDDGATVVDLALAAPALPRDMSDFIALGAKGLATAKKAVRAAKPRAVLKLAKLRLLAPLPSPRRNILCVGKNYHEHAKEFDRSGFNSTAGADAIPDFPIIFTKAPTTVIATGDKIPGHLDPTKSVDYEVELGVVIGKGGRGTSKRDAMKHVYGYTIINDVTSRHLQSRHKQWFIGKSIDGFCPMGPLLATADEVKDVRKLRLQTRVNGELRQDAVVRDLIFDIPTLIATLSRGMTLQPGDIIATGTPAGVGIGFKPPRFLKRGDVVTMTIDGLGTLENKIA